MTQHTSTSNTTTTEQSKGDLDNLSLPPPTETGLKLEELQQAINESLKQQGRGPIKDLKKLNSNGAVNHVCKATLNGDAVIVRTADATSFGTFEKEFACAVEVHGVINTPSVIHIGRTTAPDYAVHISSFIEGIDLDKEGLSLDEKIAAWKEVGVMTRKIHDIKVGGFGEELFPKSVNSAARAQSLVTWIDSLREQIGLDPSKGTTPPPPLGQFAPKIQSALEYIEGALIDCEPVLCHGNIQGNNVRVWKDKVSDSLNISLLDWGSASGHHPRLDIAELYAFPRATSHEEENAQRAAFFEGYGETVTPEEDPLLRALIIGRLAQGAAYFSSSGDSKSAEEIAGRISKF